MSSSRAADERYRALIEHPTNLITVLEAVRTDEGRIGDLRTSMPTPAICGSSIPIARGCQSACREVAPDIAEYVIALCAQVIQSGVPCSYETSAGAADFHVWLCRSARTRFSPVGPTSPAAAAPKAKCSVWLRALNAEKEWLFAALNSINEEVLHRSAGTISLRQPGGTPRIRPCLGARSVCRVDCPEPEVLRADGTPRPLDEAPPLRALNGEVIMERSRSFATRARASGATDRSVPHRCDAGRTVIVGGVGCSRRDGQQARRSAVARCGEAARAPRRRVAPL